MRLTDDSKAFCSCSAWRASGMQLLAITLDAHKGSASHNPRCSLGPPPPSAKTIVRRCGGSQMSCDASCIRFENASLLVGVEIYQPTNLSPHHTQELACSRLLQDVVISRVFVSRKGVHSADKIVYVSCSKVDCRSKTPKVGGQKKPRGPGPRTRTISDILCL